MRKFIVAAQSAALLISPVPALAEDAPQGVASQTIAFADETHRCINTSAEAVTMILTSLWVEKRDNWMTDTNAVGAQVDLRFASTTAAQTFPRAREVSTNGVGGKFVRATLNFPLLAVYEFKADSGVTTVEAPVVLLRKKGDSAVVLYANAIIDVTKEVGTMIPPNPFVQGIDFGAKLAGAFLKSAAALTPKDTAATGFQITHTLSRRPSCNANDLTDGMHAMISDPAGKTEPDMISAADHYRYCFYKLGAPSDPNIGYIAKPASGQCATTAPAAVRQLKNPQIVYLVHGVGRNAGRAAAAALHSDSLTPVSARDRRLQDKAVRHALSICAAAGIAPADCFPADAGSSK